MAERAPISFSDLLARPREPADARIAYGPLDLQFGELWLPTGPGPHPLVVMIHGGCWLADLPGLELMDQACADLKASGVAVWNLEYRRIGHEGGGYPGTFQDVAAGVNHVRGLARTYPLDLKRVVVAGHSAGGHLALWSSVRGPLRGPDPFIPKGAVSLAGIIDLAAYHATGPDACGGPGTIEALVGAESRGSRDVYADTSPLALLPLALPYAVISGALDPIVPSRFGAAFGAAAKAKGDAMRVLDLEGAGHFELIDPTAPAWVVIKADIKSRLA
ncbi:alpha/beta hydrolase [Phenylobacterium sp.]|uniref:alpha/beta hydrolase n=1 Tax=Phenylobacterium sp. TaxID=1871053 RepID=UPI002735B22B|nr:alpha/beta hydrolase [Phenylobacterium sp.]MDP3853975.1 alpha/beta hydrolase [Phenylobacterium sp.]